MTAESVTSQEASKGDKPPAPAGIEYSLEPARETTDNAAGLQSLQRAVESLPEDPRVQTAAQDSLLKALKQDAFLSYLSETDKTYTVSLQSRVVDIPKVRASFDIYPPIRLYESQRLFRLVLWMTVGLVPLGVGTLLVLPLALWRSIRLLRVRDLDPIERRRGQAALVTIMCLGIVGMGLFGLLLLHLTG